MSDSSNIAVVILAAGDSGRLGTPKQMLPLGSSSLLGHAVESALNSKCPNIVVALGAFYEEIKREICHFPVRIVRNRRWREGVASSIRASIGDLQALSRSTRAVLIMTCDQPYVTPEVIIKIMDAYVSTQKPIIACEYAGTIGVPALFDKRFFPELLTLNGDQGAKGIVNGHPGEVMTIPFPEGGVDIDTWEDYEQL